MFLKCWDEHQHRATVVLRPGAHLRPGPHVVQAGRAERPRLLHRPGGEGGDRRQAFAPAELGPGWGEAIRFEAPTGHLVKLVYGMEKVGNMLPLTNPPPRPANLVAPRLDHIFIMAEDVEAATAFFREVLEFRLDRADHRQRRSPDRHLAGTLALPARHRDRHRAERRAAPLRLLAGRLERHPRGRRSARLTA